MIRIPFTSAAMAVLLACSCGPKALELPTDPIDRAATCGVVAAAEARLATNVQSDLPFDAQLRIIDYALLAGVSDDGFSPETATNVSKRMSALQEGITKGKWQDLKPACDAAFPQVGQADAKLPADSFDTKLSCDALADFIGSALEPQENSYVNELGAYRQMRTKLNIELGAGMQRRAGSDLEAQQAERRKALARSVRFGAPGAVMKQCVARYGA